jgi:drug/metabolite transporter (DMT)-like permease
MIIRRKDLPLFVFYGLIGVCGPLFSYITAIAIGTPVVVAVSLAYLYPVITLILARITLRESLTYRRFLAVVSSTAGAIILSAPILFEYSDIPIFGVVLSTLTAVFLAAFMVLGRNFGRYEGYHSIVTTFWAYFFGSLWMGIIVLGLQFLVIDPRIVGFQLVLPIHAWLLLLGFALIATAIPYGLVNYGMKQIDATIASIVLLIDPLSSVILGIALLGQTVTFLQVIGTTLILLGTIIVATKTKLS